MVTRSHCNSERKARCKVEMKAWRCPTLTWGGPTLPSALLRFTTEFGMGSGGSIMLWSPSKFVTILKADVLNTHPSVRGVRKNPLGVVWLSLTGN